MYVLVTLVSAIRFSLVAQATGEGSKVRSWADQSRSLKMGVQHGGLEKK